MEVKLEHIGTIKKSRIALNGLTVIGGENDTGKSTVGKLIFTIIKGIGRSRQDILESKEEIIFKRLEKLYFDIRKHIRLNDELKNEFLPPIFFDRLQHLLKPERLLEHKPMPESRKILDQELDTILLKKKQLLDNTGAPVTLTQQLDEIKTEMLKEQDREADIKKALSRAFNSEFRSQLSPLASTKGSSINISEGQNNILTLEIKKNKITAFKLEDILPFDDVTFIDTPILMQMYDVIRFAKAGFEITGGERKRNLIYRNRPSITFHMKDLISKMESARYYADNEPEDLSKPMQTLHQRIGDIVNGHFDFEKDEKDFSFYKKISGSKAEKVKSMNMASGIKAFGIIQLLIRAGVLDEKSLLVIDEPENHLHPAWQVEYARVMVELVKNGIPVLLASHSPYLIQALRVFSGEDETIRQRTNFYLAEKTNASDLSGITEVTGDMNRLFRKLSEPLQKLVWK